MYDHYCPWVVAPIGEKTHRLFLAFLFFTIQASFYYTYGYYRILELVLQRQRRWPYPHTTIFYKIINVIIVSLNREPMVACCFFALGVTGLTLFIFLCLQVSQVSRNVTQVEVGKLDDLKEDGIILKKSPYDKGFIKNWMECLFPSKLEPCEPYEIEYDDEGNVIIPGSMISDDEVVEKRKELEQHEKEEEEEIRAWTESRKLAQEKEDAEGKIENDGIESK